MFMSLLHDLDIASCMHAGYNCTHLAGVHGKCNVLQVLLKAGVDLLQVDGREWSVIHHAAFHGRLGILQVLYNITSIATIIN